MAANSTSWVRKLTTAFRHHWQPEPLTEPIVDETLPDLSGIERSAEVARFTMAKLEHWLSPLGNLREFFRMNLRLAICIAVPVLLVAPVITLALERFKTWVAMLSETMSSFVLFPLSVVLSIILVCGLIYIAKSLLELRLRNNRRDGYY
jgi:hypothetical protein